jgi:rod shape-determining protein MreC
VSKVETSKGKTPLILVVLLVAQLLLMSSQAKTGESKKQTVLRSWMLTAVYPVQIVTGYVGSFIYGGWHGYIDLRGARQENEELRAKNDEMSKELLRLKEELAKSRATAELNRAQNVLPYKSVIAHVIARDGSVWFNQVIIDRGKMAELKLNQPVITSGGVVGRVVGLGPLSAQVQLITDSFAGVGAQLSDSRAYGIVKGTGKGNCKMLYVSGLENVKEGEAVITSGFDGVYPKGLLIGYVEKLIPGGGANNHQITIRPAAGLDRLENVLVLSPTEQELKIDETVK